MAAPLDGWAPSMTRLHGRIKHGRILNSVKLIVRFTSTKVSPKKYGLFLGERGGDIVLPNYRDDKMRVVSKD